MNSASFQYQFYQRYPALKDMDWSNIALKGGAIIDLILDRTPKDLDFFFYGLASEEGLLKRAREFLEFLLKTERNTVHETNEEAKKISERRVPGGRGRGRGSGGYNTIQSINIKAVRSRSVIEVCLSAISEKVQIVLCKNESLEQLSSFSDIALCGILFDGQNVLLTQSAKWELENMTLVVNGGSYYPSAERLDKYFQKGFDIILSELDVNKCPTAYLKLGMRDAIQLPSLALSYSKIQGNQIHLDQFLKLKREEKSEEKERVVSTRYGSLSDLLDRRTVLYNNIKLLTCLERSRIVSATSKTTETDDEKNMFAVFAEGDFVTDVLKPWPDISARQVKNTYHAISEQIYSGEKLDFAVYNQYVSVESLNELLKHVADQATANDKPASHVCSERVNGIVKRQIDALSSLCTDLGSEFQGKNPPVVTRADLFLNRIVEAKGFYGEYLKNSK